MNLTKEQLYENATKLVKLVESFSDQDRVTRLKKMYEDFGTAAYTQPASANVYYHNCMPGGYLDHVLRVVEYSMKFHKLWTDLGADTSTYTTEELIFAAMHHDLGKLGYPVPDGEGYLPNESKWHRENQGALYSPNTKLPFQRVPDRSLYVLQSYGIKMSLNEYQAIQIHDGLYEEANKAYYVAYQNDSKLRTNLPYILHQADLAAARFEWERDSRANINGIKV